MGVGTAVATGVASADDTTSNPPSPDTQATSGQTETTTTNTNTQTSTDPTHTPAPTDPDKETKPGSTTTNTVTGGVVVSAQTNTGTMGTTGTPEATHTAEATPTPTATASPTPATPTAPKTAEPKPKPANDNHPTPKDDVQQGISPTARIAPTVADPPAALQSADPVAVFADARTLAAASPKILSPMVASQISLVDTPPPTAATPPANPLTAITNLVTSVINGMFNPSAGGVPTAPALSPVMWGLLAFARREFDTLLSGIGPTEAEADLPAAPQMRSLALATAAVTPGRVAPGFPLPGAQLSPSTQFVNWVTGNYYSLGPNPQYDGLDWPNTAQRYSVWGTDVGTMWDNGIADNPATPINEHQILIAVGDTFSGPNMSGIWRPNTLFRSSDPNLADGMAIPDGQWFNGNMFGGAPLGPNSTTARQSIFPSGLPAGVTLIPTAGVSIPVPGSQYGAAQVLSFMSVSQWGAPGQWSTNYSALAYSFDNGENWTVAPSSVRYNQPWTGNQNFQQSAFVRPGDGYVYVYGTPNGRQGAAYISRVHELEILDPTKYEYYSKGTTMTPAGWYKNDPTKATPVFGQEAGACGVANAGNTVSEMSVQYNKQLKKYVVLYTDQNNSVVMRTSDTPEGTWSAAKVVMGQQNGGIYAPMMHPWSPSTMGTGTDLYWNLSLWSEYNVMLMRTDLTKV
ncbi:DUF4185 domain-containing protein [Mycobacterium sp. JS623]|uniref:DUF4185 domain-containing protein n=1 Tax=Mycobacterium sp. JS623 TaxID=212767 RepID=UPI001E32D4B2|nr:DUF4185 domain-containing protein [Mycobacterium sp. JS623]